MAEQRASFEDFFQADPTRRQVVHPTGYAPIWSADGEWIVFNDAGLTASSG